MRFAGFLGVLLVLFGFFSRIGAVPLWVDAQIGELVLERPENVGLWPDENGHCQETLDGQYIAHSNRYQVDYFMYQEHDFGIYGGLAQRFTLYNAAEAVVYMHARGVWAASHSCNAINHMFTTKVMQPMVNEHLHPQIQGVESSVVESQVYGVMNADLNGIVLEILCKTPENKKNKSKPASVVEYHVCEAAEIVEIAQSRQSQNHAIRADKERRYDSNVSV